jgi:NAD(P)-dependent dehydrogenase (short-subunit alcohol dehydrogenase family)
MAGEFAGTLNGKRALVTGAGRGIGRAIALELAEAGADVAITARSASELADLKAEIERLDRRAIAITCDVTDAQQVSVQLADGVLGAWGGVDILVNNAGASGSHKFVGHPDELWHRMLAINMTAAYYVSKAFVPAMVERKAGRIVMIASIAARVGGKYIAAYTAAKHGLLGLTRALAVELNPSGITVNAVCPGYVETPMTEGNIATMAALTGRTPEQVRGALEGMSPQHRLIQAAEVARIVIFLAQDTAAGITGQAINVDGGEVMS